VLVAGGGNVEIDVLGIKLAQGLGAANSIRWVDSDYLIDLGTIFTYWAGGITLAEFFVNANDALGYDAQISIAARSSQTTTDDALALLLSHGNGVNESFAELQDWIDTATFRSVFQYVRGSGDTSDWAWGSTGGAFNMMWGASDTTNLNLGYLNEKALTFASTATLGIEDPDNEMGKLWLDTDAEMRLTDTAGADWFITKSTSTGTGSRVLFSRRWTEDTTDVALAGGWQPTMGSDSGIQMRTDEMTLVTGTIWHVSGSVRIQYDTGNAAFNLGYDLLDTANTQIVGSTALVVCDITGASLTTVSGPFNFVIDTAFIAEGVYKIALIDFHSVTANRRYVGNDRYITVLEIASTFVTTT
jgi:hypothetical protein